MWDWNLLFIVAVLLLVVYLIKQHINHLPKL